MYLNELPKEPERKVITDREAAEVLLERIAHEIAETIDAGYPLAASDDYLIAYRWLKDVIETSSVVP